jgi:hypothetical protein
MGFVEYLADPVVGARYRKVKAYFYIKESAYDVTSACQLRCDGCYYFQGDKYRVRDNRDPGAWQNFMRNERERGINFVNLAGAEPALAPKILEACFEEIPLGCIFTNGLKPIAPEIRYRIHISVWGDGSGDPLYRKAANGKPGPYCLPIQLENYRGDDRVVFVYTFNNDNLDQVDEVLKRVSGGGHKLTFNVFSVPENDTSALRIGHAGSVDTLRRIRDKMFELLEQYPDTLLYSFYNAIVHTRQASLRHQFGCPYPRADGGPGLGRTFHSYRADLSYVADSDCCVPDTNCSECRHYAAGSAIVSSKLTLHAKSEALFRGWLDYVDTYLAVWILGYSKGDNLYRIDDAKQLNEYHLH